MSSTQSNIYWTVYMYIVQCPCTLYSVRFSFFVLLKIIPYGPIYMNEEAEKY